MTARSSSSSDRVPEVTPRSGAPDEDTWVGSFLQRHDSDRVASRGRLHAPSTLPGFVASIDGERIGLITYRLDGTECEIVTLHSDSENRGAGTALIRAVAKAAGEAGWRRLWLVTTNDNTHALRFYQRRGFRIAAVHVSGVEAARRDLKPEIPLLGNDGIPIRDEIELEVGL